MVLGLVRVWCIANKREALFVLNNCRGGSCEAVLEAQDSTALGRGRVS